MSKIISFILKMKRKKIKKTKNKKKLEKKISLFSSYINPFFRKIILPFLFGFFLAIIVVFIVKAIDLKTRKIQLTKKNIQEARLNRGIVKEPKTVEKKDFFALLNAVYLDPVDLLDLIKNNDKNYILIDIRSKEEFNKGHIKTAVNLTPEALLKKTNDLRKKTVILYGQTSYSSITKNTVYSLLEKNIKVKVLSVGWNEFFHFRNLWLPEILWNKMRIDQFVELAKE